MSTVSNINVGTTTFSALGSGRLTASTYIGSLQSMSLSRPYLRSPKCPEQSKCLEQGMLARRPTEQEAIPKKWWLASHTRAWLGRKSNRCTALQPHSALRLHPLWFHVVVVLTSDEHFLFIVSPLSSPSCALTLFLPKHRNILIVLLLPKTFIMCGPAAAAWH